MKFIFLLILVDLIYEDNIVMSINQETHYAMTGIVPVIAKDKIDQFNYQTQTHSQSQPDFLMKKDLINIKKDINKNSIEGSGFINSLNKSPVSFPVSFSVPVPAIKISSIDTNITIRKDKTEGEVYEKVKFKLNNGVFNTIVRKISLGGTSDKYHGFRLASTDIILIEAKVTNNCMESSSIYEHPYVCVISKFEPINATVTPKEIEIVYEYISDNILRRREKPFSSNEQENVIVWIYDNYKKNTSIDFINLFLNFENKIDMNRIIAYPEKFFTKKQSDNYKGVIINWSAKDLKENSFKNFALNLPIFNESCKGMNEIHLEITTYSVIQFFIWMTISIILLFILSYIYINKKETKEDSDTSYKENTVSTQHVDISNVYTNKLYNR